MSRQKGIPNKINYAVPPMRQMAVDERLQLVANIIKGSGSAGIIPSVYRQSN